LRLSGERITSLQKLLKELYGLDYTAEQAQEAGMAIMRFVAVKTHREQELIPYKRNEYGKAYTGSAKQQ
jgi:hypothetical protein